MKAFKSVCVFLVTFSVYHIIVSSFFPADENGVVHAPGWYPIVGLVLCIASTVLFLRWQNNRSRVRSFSKPDNQEDTNHHFSLSEPSEERRPPLIIETTKPADMIDQAVDAIFDHGAASVSLVQRRLKLGYEPAAEIIDSLELAGIIGPFDGYMPRAILLTRDDYYSRRIIQKPGVRQIDINNTPYMDSIRKLEADFEKTYKYAYDHLLNVADSQAVFEKLCNKWGAGSQPIPVQIRFEQLKEQYAPKFENPNPMLAVDSMEGHEFEHWCAELLQKVGFTNVSVTPGSGDQGVDVLAERDGVTYAIQCKCYSADLGNRPVQEVLAGKFVYNRHVGVVMTNRHFTQGAIEAAKATGVLLWDRDEIEKMLTEAEAQQK